MSELTDLDPLARAKALLAKLVAFPTVSDRSNLQLIDFVADYLRGLGARAAHRAEPAGDKAALMVTFGPRGRRRRLLSGHTDVVPVEGQPWTSDPFALREADGKLYGRGACDMKGFDAAVLPLLPEFLAAPLKSRSTCC